MLTYAEILSNFSIWQVGRFSFTIGVSTICTYMVSMINAVYVFKESGVFAVLRGFHGPHYMNTFTYEIFMTIWYDHLVSCVKLRILKLDDLFGISWIRAGWRTVLYRPSSFAPIGLYSRGGRAGAAASGSMRTRCHRSFCWRG